MQTHPQHRMWFVCWFMQPSLQSNKYCKVGCIKKCSKIHSKVHFLLYQTDLRNVYVCSYSLPVFKDYCMYPLCYKCAFNHQLLGKTPAHFTFQHFLTNFRQPVLPIYLIDIRTEIIFLFGPYSSVDEKSSTNYQEISLLFSWK